MRPKVIPALSCILAPAIALGTAAATEVARFKPKIGEALEVWRITHDPAVRE